MRDQKLQTDRNVRQEKDINKDKLCGQVREVIWSCMCTSTRIQLCLCTSEDMLEAWLAMCVFVLAPLGHVRTGPKCNCFFPLGVYDDLHSSIIMKISLVVGCS